MNFTFLSTHNFTSKDRVPLCVYNVFNKLKKRKYRIGVPTHLLHRVTLSSLALELLVVECQRVRALGKALSSTVGA